MARLYPPVKVVSPDRKKVKSRNSLVLTVCLVITFVGLIYLVAGFLNQPPGHYKIKFTTTKGVFVVEVANGWSPHGSDRLYVLVKSGFYNNSAVFRVVKNFVCQFGIASTPSQDEQWRTKYIPDDPVMQNNLKGTLVFATYGPNKRSTQLFINLKDNYKLDTQGFPPVGRVIEGMDVVSTLYNGYGDFGKGAPDPTALSRNGNGYLKAQYPKLDYIITAEIIK